MSSSYQTLVPWKRSRRLVREIYDLTSNFPAEEKYGLTSQIRRACTSVPLNLAEGSGRLTNGEWQQFLGYARGSLLELESALIIAFDLGYATREQLEPIGKRILSVIKPINGLLRSSTAGFPKKKYAVNR
jgi:four helix bundle protein